ncbi:MAG: IS1182 family transposase [Gemmatimonadota bacterium]
MLGREDEQRSFFDASLAVEGLLEPGSFYETLYREGPRLLRDEDFVECYDVTTGRPSVPPSRMFKLLLLQMYEGATDRQAVERMAFDLRWKAALGLEVGDPAVGQATLVDFRARLQLHGKMEEAFGRFLKRAMDAGVLKADEVQVLDSSPIWGRGAVEDTYNLIGSAVRKLLGVTARRRGTKPEDLAGKLGLVLTGPAEEGSLKGRAGIDWTKEEERRAFLNRVVEEARRLLEETAREERGDPEVADAAALLRRILMQDLERVSASGPDAAEPDLDADDPTQSVLGLGTEVQIRQGVAKDRVVSVGDPEMRRGHKSQNRSWDGYKAHVGVSAESELITAVHVTAANVHDGMAAAALMEQHGHRGLKPEAYVGDMAYSPAELREGAAARGTEMVARVPPATAPAGCFSKDAFTIDLEAGSITCPAGEVTHASADRVSRGGTFYFDGTVCSACTLREACTRRAPEVMRREGRGRSIRLHPLEAILQRARALENTERIQRLLKLRPLVERRLAHLMSGRGQLRQARYRGAAKTQFQAMAAALVVNLVRMASLLGEPALPPRHRDQLTAQFAVLARLISWIGAGASLADAHSYPFPCRSTHGPFRSDS